MFWKRKKKPQKRIDTSKEGFEYIGVKLTDEQFSDLLTINFMFLDEAMENNWSIPVFYIVLVLKALGLLKTEIPDNESGSDSDDNTTDNSEKKFERKFGRMIDRG